MEPPGRGASCEGDDTHEGCFRYEREAIQMQDSLIERNLFDGLLFDGLIVNYTT